MAEIKIKVYPSIGNAYEVIIPYEAEKVTDTDSFIENWVSENLMLVEEYEIIK